MRALGLSPAALVGHSKSCRVVVEAASQVPDRANRHDPRRRQPVRRRDGTESRDTFAMPNGYVALNRRWFQEIFTGRSNPTTVASVVNHAASLPRSIRGKAADGFAPLRCRPACNRLDRPICAGHGHSDNLQQRKARAAIEEQWADRVVSGHTRHLRPVRPHRDHLRRGHPPRIGESAQTNALLDGFTATLPERCEAAVIPKYADTNHAIQACWGARLCAASPIIALSIAAPAAIGLIYWEKPRAIQFLRNALIGQSLASSYEVRA